MDGSQPRALANSSSEESLETAHVDVQYIELLNKEDFVFNVSIEFSDRNIYYVEYK